MLASSFTWIHYLFRPLLGFMSDFLIHRVAINLVNSGNMKIIWKVRGNVFFPVVYFGK